FSTRRQDNAQNLVRQLYGQPVIDIKWATRTLDVSTNTAAALINDLESYGVLVEMTEQRRNRLFIFEEYLQLFQSK
ncbi:MAG: hypothetical protein QMB92_10420, partial [Thiopseudomonas sp.]